MKACYRKLVVVLLNTLLLSACADRQSLSTGGNIPERTTVGNGGHDTLALFRKEGAALIESMLNSYEATQYATEKKIDLAWLKNLVEKDDRGVDIVIANGPLYDGKRSVVKGRAIGKQRLELNESYWESALINPAPETRVTLIHELLRLHPNHPDNWDDSYHHAWELVARRSRVQFERLTPETSALGLQMANRDCPASRLKAEWLPEEKNLSLLFLYGTADVIKNKSLFQAMRPFVQCAVRFKADDTAMRGKLVPVVETHEMARLPAWTGFLNLKITQPNHFAQYRTTLYAETSNDAPAVQMVARSLADFVKTQDRAVGIEDYIVSVESTAFEKGYILPAKLELRWQ